MSWAENETADSCWRISLLHRLLWQVATHCWFPAREAARCLGSHSQNILLAVQTLLHQNPTAFMSISLFLSFREKNVFDHPRLHIAAWLKTRWRQAQMTVTGKGLQQQQHNICSDVRLSAVKCCFTDYTQDLWHKHEGRTVREDWFLLLAASW